MARTVSVRIDVITPDDVSNDEVLDAINKFIDVGAADAADTAEDEEEGSWADGGLAARAASLEVGHPVLMVAIGPPTVAWVDAK